MSLDPCCMGTSHWKPHRRDLSIRITNSRHTPNKPGSPGPRRPNSQTPRQSTPRNAQLTSQPPAHRAAAPTRPLTHLLGQTPSAPLLHAARPTESVYVLFGLSSNKYVSSPQEPHSHLHISRTHLQPQSSQPCRDASLLGPRPIGADYAGPPTAGIGNWMFWCTFDSTCQSYFRTFSDFSLRIRRNLGSGHMMEFQTGWTPRPGNCPRQWDDSQGPMLPSAL